MNISTDQSRTGNGEKIERETRRGLLQETNAIDPALNGTPIPSNKSTALLVQMLTADCLCIGSWVRHHHSLLDLKIFYTPSPTFLTYFLQVENLGFKIEFPLGWITSLDLFRAHEDLHIPFDGMLAVTISRPPLFSLNEGMEWNPCEDFTEHAAATHTLVHCIFGRLDNLEDEAMQLFQQLEAGSTGGENCHAWYTATESGFSQYDWAAYTHFDVPRSRSHSAPLRTPRQHD